MTGAPTPRRVPPRPGSRAQARPGARRRRTGPRSRDPKLVTHRWARLTHVYSSMVALLLVLFFGFTGLTLNHPQWTFGSGIQHSEERGTFPFDAVLADGTVNYLQASEFVRDTFDVSGHIDTFSTTNDQASISYRNPGYAAELFFDVRDSTYTLTVDQQGWVGVLNDLHKGRDSGSTWSWVIDLSAVFLVVIAVTGLVMQFFLRKRRTSALVVAGVGVLIVVLAVWITLS